MIDNRVCDALNRQVNAELYSAYLYVAMAGYFEAKNLKGFASWLKVQVKEELAHAEKLYGYISERGGKPAYGAISAPEATWDAPLKVFEYAYGHEVTVTQSINELVDVAISAKDHATVTMLQWYVSEQVEEEASFDDVVQQLRLAADNGAALLMMDRELATRVFTPVGTGAK